MVPEEVSQKSVADDLLLGVSFVDMYICSSYTVGLQWHCSLSTVFFFYDIMFRRMMTPFDLYWGVHVLDEWTIISII